MHVPGAEIIYLYIAAAGMCGPAGFPAALRQLRREIPMKKFISLSLAAAMALSLAACGAAESEAPAESAAESGSTAATAEGAAAPIKLGGHRPPRPAPTPCTAPPCSTAKNWPGRRSTKPRVTPVFELKFEDDTSGPRDRAERLQQPEGLGHADPAGHRHERPVLDRRRGGCGRQPVHADPVRLCGGRGPDRRQHLPDVLHRPQPGHCGRRLHQRQQPGHQHRHHL